MNKMTKSEAIIINIYNSLCDFGTKLPINNINNITDVIQTNTFQSKIMAANACYNFYLIVKQIKLKI